MTIGPSNAVIRSQSFQFAGTKVDVLVSSEQTGNAFSLVRIVNPPGCWTPPHRHRREDETVFVLSGAMRAETEDGAVDLLADDLLVLPQGRPHRLGNATERQAQFLVLCTPGGFDAFVAAAGQPCSAVAEPVAMTEADIGRLVAAAPSHGVELLGPAALPADLADRDAPVAPAALDVLGVRIQILAEFGDDDGDICLMRGQVPPGGFVPLHSHADRELLYVLSGTLSASIGRSRSWTTVGPGGVIDLADGVPHALHNRGDRPAELLLVATRRIAGLFRRAGCPAASGPPEQPSHATLMAFVHAAHASGFWLGNQDENAAIGLQGWSGSN